MKTIRNGILALAFLAPLWAFSGANRQIEAHEVVTTQITTPSNPASGKNKVYSKSDGKLYILTAAGAESEVGSGAVGTGGTSASDLYNLGLSTSVGSSALTIRLKQADGATDPGAGTAAVKVGFRSATATSGAYSAQSATAATSLVISSGSTLGHAASQQESIYVYLLDNGGALELAASSTRLEDGSIQSSTAEGGAGAADSRIVLYSTTARSSLPVRLIARLSSNQSTPGTWASAPVLVSLMPFDNFAVPSEVYVTGGNATPHGSSSTKIRRLNTTVTNVGTAITYSVGASFGSTFTINKESNYCATYRDYRTGAVATGSISVNSNQLTTSWNTITNAHRRCVFYSGASAQVGTCSVCMHLYPGDVVRPHDDGGNDATGDDVVGFSIIDMNP